MGNTKQVDRVAWAEFAVSFSRENKGRVGRVELVGDEIGHGTLAEDVALFALDRDPTGKGDDFVLSTGFKEPEQTHVIHAPTQVWQKLDENGCVASLEILDQGDVKTVITFAS